MRKSAVRGDKIQPLAAVLWRRLQEGGFILLSALAIFLFVALVTYHEADPGWSHAAGQKGIQNAAGRTGAWFSDVFLYLFGYIAYMFPAMVAYGGMRLFQNRFQLGHYHHGLWMLRILGFVLSVTAGCGLASLYFSLLDKSVPVSAGGLVGQMVGSMLLPSVGDMGSTLLLMALFLAGITLSTGLSWFGLIDVLGKGGLVLFGYCKTQAPDILQKCKTHLFRLIGIYTHSSLNINLTRLTVQPNKRISPVIMEENAVKKTPSALSLPRPFDATFFTPTENKTPVKARQAAQKPKIKTEYHTHSTLPALELLEEPQNTPQINAYSQTKLEAMSREVEARLLEFGIQVTVAGVYPGPVITRFELELAAGIKVSRISGLAKDLARALSVSRVRVVEVIPGKSYVGLEIPNQQRETVRLREILESNEYTESLSPLSLALGKDIGGYPVVVNLAKMPHLLVAGTTGSGKSVGINAMLLSLLYKATPEELRLILIDPKMLELSIYDGIGHLLTPVVTDMKDAANALRWCVAEMEKRYRLMAAVGVRNLIGYNRKIQEAEEENKPLTDPLWQHKPGIDQMAPPLLTRLPYIVVIIDEFADMMMVVGKKVEELIARIAQKARAAGIHLILATQRPSVDVITGLIKANVPTRIAFQVSSRIDSRTILDQQGAEQLLGHGDMLYLPPGSGIPTRIHGAFVSDEEVHAVVKAIKSCGEPDFAEDILGGGGALSMGSFDGMEEEGEQDDLYDEAVRIVTESRKASISHLQRRLKIGYNRAARLIETMEASGVVSPMHSNGGREVLAGEPPDEEIF